MTALPHTSALSRGARDIFPDGELAHAAELGAIDDAGVRVWVRAPGTPTITARLEVAGAPAAIATVHLSEDSDWTGVLALRLATPAPNQLFVVRIGERALHGRLSPAPEEHVGLVFGFGSCHQPFVDRPGGRLARHRGAAIYPRMLRTLERADARLLFLVGDQMYSEATAAASVRLATRLGTPPLAAYRRAYRGYFAERGLRALRERWPTMCIWDDHEIFNDWGSLLHESRDDRALFAAACRAYAEYQHQRNPGGALGPPPYHYRVRYGDIGFLVLDLRGARDFAGGTLLGAAQWSDVQNWLAGDAFATIRTLFVVSGVPMAHAARWFCRAVELGWRTGLPLKRGDVTSVRDRWASTGLRRNRDALLDALFAWQAGAGARQVVLLSGDIHAAVESVIVDRRGRGIIRQFTSSALTTPPSRAQALFNRIAMRAPNLLEPRWRFYHGRLVTANNFGLVRVTPRPDGGHDVRFRVCR